MKDSGVGSIFVPGVCRSYVQDSGVGGIFVVGGFASCLFIVVVVGVSDLQVVTFLYLSGVFMSLRKLGNVSARQLYWLGLWWLVSVCWLCGMTMKAKVDLWLFVGLVSDIVSMLHFA